jgi:cytochrome c556
MVAWIDHSGHELWDTEKRGNAPKNDADWRRLERHAIQLAAAGTLISLGGTGEYDREWSQRPGWNTQAQALADAAVASLNAVRSKNFEAVVAANGRLTDTCEGCHDEFKPSLPTEGIVHQPY